MLRFYFYLCSFFNLIRRHVKLLKGSPGHTQIEKLTLPKLPFPSTFRKLKSSTQYFLNLGMVVAGGVIRPLLWKLRYVLLWLTSSGKSAKSKANAGFVAGFNVFPGESRLSIDPAN